MLRVEDRRRESPPTLDQARPQIVRYLTYEGVRQLLEELRGKAKVDVLLAAESGAPQEPASAAPARPAPSPTPTAPTTTAPAPAAPPVATPAPAATPAKAAAQ